MAKRTPQQEVEFQMQKLKDMGVTISTVPARNAPDTPNRVVHIIADAAKAAGIYEEKSN